MPGGAAVFAGDQRGTLAQFHSARCEWRTDLEEAARAINAAEPAAVRRLSVRVDPLCCAARADALMRTQQTDPRVRCASHVALPAGLSSVGDGLIVSFGASELFVFAGRELAARIPTRSSVLAVRARRPAGPSGRGRTPRCADVPRGLLRGKRG